MGIFKNHTISNELLLTAVGACKLLPFTTAYSGLGKHKGETLNIMHVKELADPTDATLDEDTRIPVDKLEWGNRAITVVEWGRGAEYTNLNQQLAKFDPASAIQKALVRQMNRAMDNGVADAMQSASGVKICFIPTSLTGGTFDTDGTPSTVATANLTADHMGVLADYLAGNIHCPPYRGDEYIMVACRKALRGLKQDTRVQETYNYLQKGELFFKGEVGKIENIRMVQIDREGAISNTAGTSTVLGDAVLFGDEAVARVEVESPELRADPNFRSDFGRVHAVAWYGILAFASIWATATDGEAKIIRITSA